MQYLPQLNLLEFGSVPPNKDKYNLIHLRDDGCEVAVPLGVTDAFA